MSPPKVVGMIFCVVVVQTVCGQSCQDYEVVVTVTPGIQYLGTNVSMYCAYTATDTTSILWRLRVQGIRGSGDVYEHNLETGKARARGDYVGQVDGQFVDSNNHSLIIINAAGKYAECSWQCSVYTTDCGFGKPSNKQAMSLTAPKSRGLNIRAVNAAAGQADVTCYAVSDPASKLSFIGLPTPETQCTRVTGDTGQLWNCSISAKATQNSKVSCFLSILGVRMTSVPVVSTFVPAVACVDGVSNDADPLN